MCYLTLDIKTESYGCYLYKTYLILNRALTAWRSSYLLIFSIAGNFQLFLFKRSVKWFANQSKGKKNECAQLECPFNLIKVVSHNTS